MNFTWTARNVPQQKKHLLLLCCIHVDFTLQWLLHTQSEVISGGGGGVAVRQEETANSIINVNMNAIDYESRARSLLKIMYDPQQTVYCGSYTISLMAIHLRSAQELRECSSDGTRRGGSWFSAGQVYWTLRVPVNETFIRDPKLPLIMSSRLQFPFD